jgi:RasGEF domain
MRVPSPVMPKGEMTFLNFDDVEVARQLTLMEYESYCCIRPRECLNQAWSRSNKEEESPNIVTMIRRSNNIPLWVATEIIKEDKLQRRAYVLKKFINIAEVLSSPFLPSYPHRINSFHSTVGC